MIQSLILRTASRYLLPLLILFSVFIFLRGHNAPGGGFVGGLLAASAFALHAIAFGIDETRVMLTVRPITLIGVGLLAAIVSALIGPLFARVPFMTALWGTQPIPVIEKFNTPLLFDLGVSLTVIGVVLLIVFTLMEDLQEDTN